MGRAGETAELTKKCVAVDPAILSEGEDMRYFGLDVHPRSIYVTCLHFEDGVPHLKQWELAYEDLERFILSSLQPDDCLALEATTNCFELYHCLKEAVPQGRVAVANTSKLKWISQSNAKTDRNDSRILAQLLAAGCLPEVWVPDRQTLEDREILRHRARLVKDETRCKNRIRSLLVSHNMTVDKKGSIRQIALLSQRLPSSARQVLSSLLLQLEQLGESVKEMDRVVDARAADRGPELDLLCTIPGVSNLTGLTILAGIGEIKRFATPMSLANYVGLVPRLRSSAGQSKQGGITKAGPRSLRWALAVAAQQAVKHSPSLKLFYMRLCRRKGKGLALTAVCRKLVEAIWHMLTRAEAYRDAPAAQVERKLAKRREKHLAAKTACRPAALPSRHWSILLELSPTSDSVPGINKRNKLNRSSLNLAQEVA